MMPDLTLAVPCFGTSPRWVAMLDIWLSHYLKSGCRLPVVVLTDMDTAIPQLPRRVGLLRFDPRANPHILRDGQPFDIQGALIVQAIRYLGPLVIMDSDALILRDPTEEFLNLRASRHLFGMAPDAGGRTLPVDGQDLPERNGGVLYFSESAHEAGLAAAYHHIFEALRATHGQLPTLQQIAWSVLWHRLDAQSLAANIPRRLNSSHLWDIAPDTVIRHEHGDAKWTRTKAANA